MRGVRDRFGVRARGRLSAMVLPPGIPYPIDPGIAPHSEVMITTSIAGMIAGFFRDRLGGGQRGD